MSEDPENTAPDVDTFVDQMIKALRVHGLQEDNVHGDMHSMLCGAIEGWLDLREQRKPELESRIDTPRATTWRSGTASPTFETVCEACGLTFKEHLIVPGAGDRCPPPARPVPCNSGARVEPVRPIATTEETWTSTDEGRSWARSPSAFEVLEEKVRKYAESHALSDFDVSACAKLLMSYPPERLAAMYVRDQALLARLAKENEEQRRERALAKGPHVHVHKAMWDQLREERAKLHARIEELEKAIGVMVPMSLRVLLQTLPADADIDRDVTEKVLARVEEAMATAADQTARMRGKCAAPDVDCPEVPVWSGRCREHYWRMAAGQEPSADEKGLSNPTK